MTIPPAVGKTNVDDGASDTPAAGRQDIENVIDGFNDLRTHLLGSTITSTPLGIGSGLQAAGNNLAVNVGNGIGQIVQLANVGGSAGLPAVDGSQLTGVAGGLLQLVIDQDGTPASGANSIPLDNTIPQNTEGVEFQTVTITPNSASSTLLIIHAGQYSASIGGNLNVALFKDSEADALAATTVLISTSGASVTLIHSIASGSTTSQTYKVRAGMGTASTTMYFNRLDSTTVFGSAPKSVLLVLEIA